MSYKPPLEIETEVEKVAEEVKAKDEEFVMKSVRSLTLKADKDELVKALAYDRDQYQKGYEDGYKDGCKDGKRNNEVKHGKWIACDTDIQTAIIFKCSECGRKIRVPLGNDYKMQYPYCHCGAKMDLR